MSKGIRFLVLALCVGAVGIGRVGIASAAEKSPAGKVAVELTLPEKDSTVQIYEAIEGTISGKGWPVVLVQPVAPEEPWYIQKPVESCADGEFSGHAYFGTEKTPVGMKFRVVVLVAPSEEKASEYKVGEALKTLPKLPKSKAITVTRG